MGGKFAAILARHAEDGTIGLENLRGIVLVSPSPPCPEPMDESKREQTIQALGQRTLDRAAFRKHAATFVDDNTGKLPLIDPIKDRTVADLLRMNPDALQAWMMTGSKEDWSEKVGVLTTPALILAGTEEEALGPDAQQTHTLPHFANATLVPLEGCGHLAPLERPAEIAARMVDFFQTHHLAQPVAVSLNPDFTALIASDRTAPQTREALLSRLDAHPPAEPVFTPQPRLTLRALAARILPDAPFDPVIRLESTLAQPQHDGWRFNALPDDRAAWKQGLASLDAAANHSFGVSFIALDSARQDGLLHNAQAGKLDKSLIASLHIGDDADTFTASQMRDWFEDVRGEFAKLYTADPRAMQRVGFTGFADEQGFTHITLAAQQEPQP